MPSCTSVNSGNRSRNAELPEAIRSAIIYAYESHEKPTQIASRLVIARSTKLYIIQSIAFHLLAICNLSYVLAARRSLNPLRADISFFLFAVTRLTVTRLLFMNRVLKY
jgi:hypothetical protein